MTEVTRKTSFKEAKLIYADDSNPPELRAKAKERMDEIKAWLKAKDEKEVKPSFTSDEINTDKLAIPGDQVAEITNASVELAERLLVVLKAATDVCHRAGISHPATIGMVFNQMCEQRRYSGS